MPGKPVILFPHEIDILLAALQRDLRRQSELAQNSGACRVACEMNVHYVARLIDLLQSAAAPDRNAEAVRRGRDELGLVLST